MDPERLLGKMISGFVGGAAKAAMGSGKKTRKKRRKKQGGVFDQLTGQLTTGAGLMGALGLAMGAVEAYQRSSAASANAAAAGPPPVPGAGAAPPPIPGAEPAAAPPPIPGAEPAAAAAPPPIPGAEPAPAAAPPPVPGAEADGPSPAIRMIQVMIAAAHADGQLDEDERSNILSQLEAAEATEEERGFVEAELGKPRPLSELTAGVEDPGQKRLMYGLAVAAIDVDSFEEFQFLQELGSSLGLEAGEMEALRNQFGGEKVEA